MASNEGNDGDSREHDEGGYLPIEYANAGDIDSTSQQPEAFEPDDDDDDSNQSGLEGMRCVPKQSPFCVPGRLVG